MAKDLVLLNARNTTYKSSVRCLQDEVASSLHLVAHVCVQEVPCLHSYIPRKSRTHPVSYVGFHKSYRDPYLLRLKALAPPKVAMPRILEHASGYRAVLLNEVYPAPGPVSESPLTLGVPHAREDAAPRDLSRRQSLDVNWHGMPPMYRPRQFWSMSNETTTSMCRDF